MMQALVIATVPLFGFTRLAYGRAHEGLDDEHFDQLLNAIMAKDGGDAVGTQILGMRIFGGHSDKLPISEPMKATCRTFLSRVQFAAGTKLDHMIREIVEAAFDKPEYEGQSRAFSARILAAIGDWNIHAWDVVDVITALTKAFPVVVLDTFVEEAVGIGPGRTVFQSIDCNRACPLALVPDDVWMAWAAKRPDTRFELLARVMRFSNPSADDHAKGWSPPAMTLIEVAPDPVKVLDTFFRRFTPSGWSGSLADTLATRLPLIEILKQQIELATRGLNEGQFA